MMPAPEKTEIGPVLEIEALDVSFKTDTGSVDAVKEVSLAIRPGETLALVGESGSGKSTVSLAAMGLLPSNATAKGRIRIAEIDTVGAKPSTLRKLRGNAVSMVFQEPATALDPLKRIGAQIVEVIRNHRDASNGDAHSEAIDLLRRVGIPDPDRRISSYPFQLSGGQRQRVVIAMAIANRPDLLIADEPTTALDVTVQAEILDLLRGLAQESQTAILLVTHNMGVVADFADRVAVMLNGRIIETGSVHDVLLRPAEAYTQKLLSAVPRLNSVSVERTADSVDMDVELHKVKPIVELRDITVEFGRGAGAVTALDAVSVAVNSGETVALVGESGSGKSTAARVALGLIKPTRGQISLFDKDFSSTGSRARRRLRSGIGVILQDPVASLDARMTVAQCVSEPLRIHRRSMSAKERAVVVAEALEQVRLPRSMAMRTPRELSGGQRQRVSIARALVLNPRLIVADEPTSALDVSVQQSVLDVLTELQEELKFACLFISHDLAVVQHFAERVAVMRSGAVVEEGRTDVTLISPQTDYTRRLLAAVPVADPVVQRRRRAERMRVLEAGRVAVAGE